MKRVALNTAITLAAVLGAIAFASGARAQAPDGPKLAQQKACLACHQIDKKLVGPAYKEVAAKYRADKNAVANMVKSIRNGSQGKWGPQVPMPPNTTVNDAEAAILAKWILTLK